MHGAIRAASVFVDPPANHSPPILWSLGPPRLRRASADTVRPGPRADLRSIATDSAVGKMDDPLARLSAVGKNGSSVPHSRFSLAVWVTLSGHLHPLCRSHKALWFVPTMTTTAVAALQIEAYRSQP